MKGWYKQLRNRWERSWFKNAKANQLYDYLKDVAYVNDGSYHGVIIRRGSCPTTRAEMMEATGQTYAEIRLSLKILQDYGEIIVKASNKFTIVTICDYDTLNTPDDLFSAYDDQLGSNQGLTEVQPESNRSLTTPIYKKEGRNIEDNNNLRSNFIPSKTEREGAKGLVYEIKEIYNTTFDGILRKWQRLSDKMVAKVGMCISRFGRQSIDMVFEQIKHEQLNLNKNGFVPDFDFIFSLNQYETYLERYKLRLKRKQAEPQQAQPSQRSVGNFEDTVTPVSAPVRISKEQYERDMREYAKQYPDGHVAKMVAEWDRLAKENETK